LAWGVTSALQLPTIVVQSQRHCAHALEGVPAIIAAAIKKGVMRAICAVLLERALIILIPDVDSLGLESS